MAFYRGFGKENIAGTQIDRGDFEEQLRKTRGIDATKSGRNIQIGDIKTGGTSGGAQFAQANGRFFFHDTLGRDIEVNRTDIPTGASIQDRTGIFSDVIELPGSQGLVKSTSGLFTDPTQAGKDLASSQASLAEAARLGVGVPGEEAVASGQFTAEQQAQAVAGEAKFTPEQIATDQAQFLAKQERRELGLTELPDVNDATLKQNLPFKDGLGDEQQQSIINLLRSGRTFNDTDAANVAYAFGMKPEDLTGKSGADFIDTVSKEIEVDETITDEDLTDAFENPVSDFDISNLINDQTELRKMIMDAVKPSDAENELKQELVNLKNDAELLRQSFEEGVVDVEGQAIPMEFITGQARELEKRANLEMSNLQRQEANVLAQLGLEQEIRTSNLEALEAGLGFLESDINLAFRAEEKRVQDEERLYNRIRNLEGDAADTLSTILSGLEGLGSDDLTQEMTNKLMGMAQKAGIPYDLMIAGMDNIKQQGLLAAAMDRDTSVQSFDGKKVLIDNQTGLTIRVLGNEKGPSVPSGPGSDVGTPKGVIKFDQSTKEILARANFTSDEITAMEEEVNARGINSVVEGITKSWGDDLSEEDKKAMDKQIVAAELAIGGFTSSQTGEEVDKLDRGSLTENITNSLKSMKDDDNYTRTEAEEQIKFELSDGVTNEETGDFVLNSGEERIIKETLDAVFPGEDIQETETGKTIWEKGIDWFKSGGFLNKY